MNNNPNFTPHLAYSASAGSGKTFALSVRYISLLFMEESPSSILAATFTNKAAAEMRQRVVDSLRGLGDFEWRNNKKNKSFVTKVCETSNLSEDELVKQQPEVLARFLSHSSYIVTLDSFFSSILRSASLELGLEPDFVTKTEGEDELEKHFLDEVQVNGLLSNLVKLAIDIEDKRFGKIFDLMQNFYKVDSLLPEQKESAVSLKNIEENIDGQREKIKKLIEESGASQAAINNFISRKIKDVIARDIFAKSSLLEAKNYKKYVEKNPEQKPPLLNFLEKLSNTSRLHRM